MAPASTAGAGLVKHHASGQPPVGEAVGYEQLLSIQQHQHALAMQQKGAEVAHLKAMLDMVEAEKSNDESHIAAVLLTKDEEAALMMASKHKELELMAALLQMREQQIEEFRQLCEAQQLEIRELQQRCQKGAVDGIAAELGEQLRSGHNGVAVRGSVGVPRAEHGVADAEDSAVLQREVRRLRLRLEELESTVGDQSERSAGIARGLAAKDERVKHLEETIRNLRLSAGASDQLTGSWGGSVTAGHGMGDGVGSDVPGGDSKVLGRLQRGGSMPSMPAPPSADGQRHGGGTHQASTALDATVLRRLQAGQAIHRQPSPSDDLDTSHPSLMSQLQSYRSAIRVDAAEVASSSQPSPQHQGMLPEVSETSRQSHELLREMRRLRQQMTELERVHGAARAGTQPAQQPQAPGVDHMYTTSSTYETGTPVTSAPHSGGVDARFETQWLSSQDPSANIGHGRPEAEGRTEAGPVLRTLPRVPEAQGAAATASAAPQAFVEGHRNSPSWPWPGLQTQQDAEPPLRHSLSPISLSGASGRSMPSAQEQRSAEFAGWEYRPHASGDAVDAAVAQLVNRPGKYRGWRALLCRLDQGVYLCGTRRVHLRVDVAQEHIEASDDGGRTWADLEDLMRGAEASQRALLERARDAVGLIG
eukprot:gnl/TRDRNA2_/TRDRNA2_193294_c0_seq1.p1 gnl/TRDRNA2_/TRDRNA2_193294_c0~~gnl/TRDRNA2_/TRDRNA2_193294_c0_seq1.p1  ORF type:complete len:671 (-),score=148.82 gnl/TRDRNA2_/TRDRNA2_193294_c0_seq1:98-2038(-)